jgi:hypothetical protein
VNAFSGWGWGWANRELRVEETLSAGEELIDSALVFRPAGVAVSACSL